MDISLFPSHVQLEHHDVKLRLPIPRRPYLVYFNPHNFERSWAILDLGLTSFDHHESLAVSNPGGCARGVLKVGCDGPAALAGGVLDIICFLVLVVCVFLV